MDWIAKPGVLRQERLRRGLSVAALADLAKVSEKSIRRAEAGEVASWRADTVNGLSTALGLDRDRLATMADGQGVSPSYFRENWRGFRDEGVETLRFWALLIEGQPG